MVTAIVLIKTDKSSIPATAETLAALEGVGSVYSVTGAWDLVAMVKVRRYEDLADVIEALGVDLSMPTRKAEECAEAVGITFLFAQNYHPSMKYVAPVRKQLGVPTVFNFLGPLSNPAQVTAQALGCSSEAMVPLLAQVLADRWGCWSRRRRSSRVSWS